MANHESFHYSSPEWPKSVPERAKESERVPRVYEFIHTYTCLYMYFYTFVFVCARAVSVMPR